MAKYINSLEFEENNASTFSAESYMNRGKDFHGKETTASTILGSACSANGDYSVAAGIGTQAGASASTVVGKYNTKVCADNAFVVGNGTTGKTSDAFVVDWKGNVSAWGNVYASGCELAKVKNYYNKDEIGDMLSKLGSFVVVSAGSITPDIAGKQLNPEDAKTTNIYLEGPFTLHEHVNDAYKEWIVTGEIGSKQWTMIGTTEVDICDLMKKVEGGDKLKDHIGILNEKGEIIDSGKSIEEVGNYSAGDHIEISDDKVISVSGVKEYKNSDSIEYTVDGNDVSFIVNENWLKEHAGSNYTAGEHIEISDDNVISVTGAKSFNSVSLSTSEDDDNINIEVNEDWLAEHAGSNYTAGDFIDISDDKVISVTGIDSTSYLNRSLSFNSVTNASAFTLGSACSASNEFSVAEGLCTSAGGKKTRVLTTMPLTIMNNTYGGSANFISNVAHYDVMYPDIIFAEEYDLEDYVGSEEYKRYIKIETTNLCMHAEGYFTTATMFGSHAEGERTFASGVNAHAEGTQTSAIGSYSHAEGYQTYAKGNCSHAEGWESSAFGVDSHAEGDRTVATGKCSHAEGYKTSAKGIVSHAEGYQTYAKGNYSHAEGYQTSALGQGSHAEGYIFGGEIIASGYGSHAGGYAKTSGTIKSDELGSFAHGYVSDSGIISASGAGAVAMGASYNNTDQVTVANGNGSVALGIGASAIPESFGAAIALGRSVIANNNYAIAEGFGTSSLATASHAEGYQTYAKGNYSHAEGYKTSAIEYYSHAEGKNTVASHNASHAEGAYTSATGQCSHAEGWESSAFGEDSHAEGDRTVATGQCSHAEGWQSSATGQRSHAEGCYTIATGDSTHAQGKYNTVANAGNAFIIGNGTSKTSRKDAYIVDWNGNTSAAGTVSDKDGNVRMSDYKFVVTDEVPDELATKTIYIF